MIAKNNLENVNNLIENDKNNAITNSNCNCDCDCDLDILNKLIKSSNAEARAKAKVNLCTNEDIVNTNSELENLDENENKDDDNTAALFEKLTNDINEIPYGPVFFTNEPTFTCECLFGVCTVTKDCNGFDKDAVNAIEVAAAHESLIR